MLKSNYKKFDLDPYLCFILFLGFVARVSYFLCCAPRQPLYSDEKSVYIPAANYIAESGFGYFLTPRSLWSGPLNPIWIAMFRSNVFYVHCANVCLVTFLCIATSYIALKMFGTGASRFCAALVSFYPPFFIFGPTVLTEAPFCFLLGGSLFLFFLGTSNRKHSVVIVLCSGALLGLSALTRPSLQFFPIFLLASWSFFRIARVRLATDLFKSSLVMTVGFYVIVLPWHAKNYILFHKFGLANGSGAVLYLGNDLRKDGDEPVYSRMNYDTGEITGSFTHLDSEGDKLLTDTAISMILKNPTDIAMLTAEKPFKFLFGSASQYFFPYQSLPAYLSHYPYREQIFPQLISMCLTVFVTVGGLLGLFRIRHCPLEAYHFLCLILVVYFVAIHSITLPILRLLLPIIPILCIFSAGLITNQHRVLPVVLSFATIICSFISFSNCFTVFGIVNSHYRDFFNIMRVVDIAHVPPSHDVIVHDSVITSTGVDPFVVFSFDPLTIATNQVIFLELKSDLSGVVASSETRQAQIFWSDTGCSFSEAKSELFTVKMDSRANIYRISPSLSRNWTGELACLRVDFPDGQLGVSYQVLSLIIAK